MDFRNITAITLGLSLVLVQGCNSKTKPEAQSSGGSESSLAKSAKADTPTKKDVVEPEAVAALKEMSDFLMSAQALGVQSQGSIDAVTETGQRIQLDGTTNYKIRKNGFVIDFKSDIKNRTFYYDGKDFTVYSPKLGLYATVPAPATTREVLNTLYDKFGIALPLEDLFRWSDASRDDRLKGFTSAYKVGTATIDGVETDQFAFREPGVDWQIWLDQGPKPFPRQMVIVDRDDPAKPTFTAHLKWQMNPAFAASDFTFKPKADDKKIAMATYKGRGE